MSNEIVTYRYSDSDFVAFLVMNGYGIKQIEIAEDKKNYNRLKAFVHVEGDKGELISLHKEYKSKQLKVDLIQFSKNFKYVNRLIKDKLKEYK